MLNEGIPESQFMESQSQTQGQQTQSTQTASQQSRHGINGHLWGFLQPCNIAVARIDFWKIQPAYTIGRSKLENDLIFPGFKVSNKHCKIVWDGKEDRSSAVTIADYSSNGTYINGVKIGQGHTGILREGNEVAFGTCVPQHQNGGLEDYRFVYRHLAAGLPTEGLYAFYDISSELGKGSFATVMKAISRTTGKWYAVKMIHENKIFRGVEGPTKANALAREISILEQLKHPNICQLKEVFVQDGNISLVLELVEGGDLLEYILKRGGLPEGETKHITYQICEALAYVHNKGIAHRDLKPENVLLTMDVPPIVKVADFGLAKVVDSLTILKTMCGTPSYLAPEVVTQNNQEGYLHVVDSWSVGVIVFSMLTNTTPFIEDETQPDIKVRVANRRVQWGALDDANISPDGQAFIRRLLEIRPSIRMTLAAARAHPWLRHCQRQYLEAQKRAMTRSPSPENTSVNTSMVSDMEDEINHDVGYDGQDMSVSHDLQGMQIDQDVAGDRSMSDTTTVQNGGSGTAPLRRRSLVLSQAAEGGGGIVPEPSWEMIHNTAYNNAAEAAAGQAATRGNKRGHSALTPLPEDMEEDGGNTPLSPADVDTPRKKGKGSSKSNADGRGKNGTASAPTSTRHTRSSQKNEAMSDDEAGSSTKPRSRRSTRQTPQKATRRV